VKGTTTKKKDIDRRLYDAFREYEVRAKNAEDFANKYRLPFSKDAFGRNQRISAIASYKKDLKEYGYAFIPSSTTISGRAAAWYGKNNKKGGDEK
jgi:hypothetical protein